MNRIKHLENKYSLARYELIRECDGDEMRFYLYLKLYAINKHEAFPTYTTISNDLGWDRKKISRIIKLMVKKGRLKIGKIERKIRSVKQQVNIYDITWYDHLNNQGKNGVKSKEGSGNLELPIKTEGSGKMEPKQVVSNKPLETMSDKPTMDWNLEKEIEKLIVDPKRHIQVIGVWIREMKFAPENNQQMQSLIRRSLRPAKLLEGYKDTDIRETIQAMRNTDYLKRFTMETCLKFIDPIVAQKKKEGPRIIRFDRIQKPDGKIVMKPIYG